MTHIGPSGEAPAGRLFRSETGSLNLAKNLRYLCAFYPSVSSVCRKTGLNRQQFNKYITGKVHPSLSTLRRIADFFGLDVEEMWLDHQSLRQLFEARKVGEPRERQENQDATPIMGAIRNLAVRFAKSDRTTLSRYCGHYFRYHYAFDGSGRIVRSVFRVVEQDGVFVTKLMERLHHQSNGTHRFTTLKYEGVLMAMSGCLFNVEYETIMKSCVGYAAFAHLQRPGQRFIPGIQSSFSSSSGKPASSRVVLERIPVSESPRNMIKSCGMFRPGNDAIDQDIIALIDNSNGADGAIFSLPIV